MLNASDSSGGDDSDMASDGALDGVDIDSSIHQSVPAVPGLTRCPTAPLAPSPKE